MYWVCIFFLLFSGDKCFVVGDCEYDNIVPLRFCHCREDIEQGIIDLFDCWEETPVSMTPEALDEMLYIAEVVPLNIKIEISPEIKRHCKKPKKSGE